MCVLFYFSFNVSLKWLYALPQQVLLSLSLLLLLERIICWRCFCQGNRWIVSMLDLQRHFPEVEDGWNNSNNRIIYEFDQYLYYYLEMTTSIICSLVNHFFSRSPDGGSSNFRKRRRRKAPPSREGNPKLFLFFSDFILWQVRLYVFIRNKLFQPCRKWSLGGQPVDIFKRNLVASMLLARNPFRFECHVLP